MAEQIREFIDQYAMGMADLEYVYATEMESSLMTAEDNRAKADFPINYLGRRGGGGGDRLELQMSEFGPQDAYHTCKVCTATECAGHWGLIEFPFSKTGRDGERLMIFHPNYINVIKDILSVVCQTCWRLIPNQQDPLVKEKLATILAAAPAKRLSMLKELVTKTTKHSGCSRMEESGKGVGMICSTSYKVLGSEYGIKVQATPTNKPKEKKGIKRKKPEKENVEPDGDTDDEDIEAKTKEITGKVQEISLRPQDVFNGFMLIDESSKDRAKYVPDLEYLGLTKKYLAGLFMTNMLIMPTQYRPRTNKAKNDKLTVLISGIMDTCAAYETSTKGDTGKEKDLFIKVSEYYFTISSKIGQKKGIYRSKIEGKRPGFGARSVIIPSETNIGEIEIPEVIARGLTSRPVLVTEDNIEALQELMYEGHIGQIEKVRGKNPGRWIRIEADNYSDKAAHVLEVGDRVRPHLKTGDIIVTGRQPTQNQQNLFGVVVKVVPGNVMKININYTGPLGADFDGDTMWIISPQTDEAAEEVLELMNIGRHVRSHQKGIPIYALTYNAVVAASLLTFPDTIIDKDLYEECTFTYRQHERMKTLPERLRKYNVDPSSGHALFSSLLPPDFYYKGGDKFKYVEISEGILHNGGMLSNSTVGTSSGSIVDRMSLMYEENYLVTTNFINDATKMLSVFIDAYGFSVSYEDCLFGLQKGIEATLSEKIDEAYRTILKLKPPETSFEEKKYEKAITGIVNGLKSVAAGVFLDVNRFENSLLVMSELVSGTKGKEGNVAGIVISLGQQILLGQRMPRSVTDEQRSIITQRPGSVLPEARGYIRNSFVSGLTPNETQQLAASGREGMVSTATITPNLGKMQRLLQRGLENIFTYKGSAVFHDNVVLDFCYGGDSMDGVSLMRVDNVFQPYDLKTMADIINAELS